MSQENYAAMAFRANLERDPDLMTFNVEQIEQKQNEVRAARAAANPPKLEPAREEYNRLNSQLFALKQNAHAMEVRVNNGAGNVREFENRITKALKLKKQHEDAGNLIGARSYEHQIQGFETELADAREQLVKDQRWNSGAARQLRTWQTENGPRLKELQKGSWLTKFAV
jgi:predicted  nucleic acid-binding Zn-ribbon protein